MDVRLLSLNIWEVFLRPNMPQKDACANASIMQYHFTVGMLVA
jgi:hypothetical protein